MPRCSRAPAGALALACFLAGFLLLAACDSRGAAGAERGAAGAERGDCRPDGTCEAGLLCLSKLCVRPPPADCRAVATVLASFELGNYAAEEELAPAVAKQRAACERAFVSKEEGACFDAARDLWSAELCAPRMFPAAAPADAAVCARIVERLQVKGDIAPPQRAWIDTALRALAESCREDRWPRDLVKCALEQAQPGDVSLGACNGRAPRGLTMRIASRISDAARAQMR
jgi:hypothetical protein